MAKKIGIYAGVKTAKANTFSGKKTGSLKQRTQKGPLSK
jgi:hypothetical protein